tara:strand:- start:464 stop:850 length:387 start_codon:yes stop_codon:yes gene_type:complete
MKWHSFRVEEDDDRDTEKDQDRDQEDTDLDDLDREDDHVEDRLLRDLFAQWMVSAARPCRTSSRMSQSSTKMGSSKKRSGSAKLWTPGSLTQVRFPSWILWRAVSISRDGVSLRLLLRTRNSKLGGRL